MKKMYKRYGTLRAQGQEYALLRPLPFEPEYTIPGTDAYFVAYAIDIWEDNEFFPYSNPHVVYIKGDYLLDMEPGDAEDIAVYAEEEAEPTYNIKIDAEDLTGEQQFLFDEYAGRTK